MSLGTLLHIALRALAINKLRSALTMLGIVIGVAAVIVMVAVGAGARARVEDQMRALGSNLLHVMPGARTQSGLRLPQGSSQTLSEDDALAINREVPGAIAAPVLRGTAQVVAGSANWATTIYGTTPEYLLAREWPLAAGRGFTPAELSGAGKVCLVGATVVRELFGGVDPIDEVVRIKRVPFTVVGVLETKGTSVMGSDQDDIIMVPIGAARSRVLGSATQARQRAVQSIWVKAADGDLAGVESQIRALLRQRHRLSPEAADDFWLRNLQDMMSAQEASSRVLAMLLAAVASVSLLVGGIGIMNIMLVSVTERTREIGLRMAVGARGRDILGQFLVEAVTLSLIGGLAGVALGAAGALAIAELAGWRVVLHPQAVVLAVAFALAVGVIFGLYPARKAARLSPVEALRFE